MVASKNSVSCVELPVVERIESPQWSNSRRDLGDSDDQEVATLRNEANISEQTQALMRTDASLLRCGVSGVACGRWLDSAREDSRCHTMYDDPT